MSNVWRNRAPGSSADAPQIGRREAAVETPPVVAAQSTSSELVQAAQVSPVEDARSGESALASEETAAVALAAKTRSVSDLLERGKEIKFEGANSAECRDNMDVWDPF